MNTAGADTPALLQPTASNAAPADPSSPTQLVSNVSDEQVYLSWTPPKIITDYYEVYQSSACDPKSDAPVVLIPGMGVPGCAIPGLSIGTDYYFYVTAVAKGIRSPASNIVKATLPSRSALRGIQLPAKQEIYISSPSQAISSEMVKEGDLLTFTVAADVICDLVPGDDSTRTVVIPKNNPVLCKVVEAQHSYGAFQKGRLAIGIIGVETADGFLIPVTAPDLNSDDHHPLVKNMLGKLSRDSTKIRTQNNVTYDKTALNLVVHDEQKANADKQGFHSDLLPGLSEYDIYKGAHSPSQSPNELPTFAVVYGRSDNTPLIGAIGGLAATYGIGTISSGQQGVDAVSLGLAINTSTLQPIFTGVPTILPASTTFTVFALGRPIVYITQSVVIGAGK